MDRRPLGTTGMMVSPIGLGTVKLGRDSQVKYPETFRIPDDDEARHLLVVAQGLGINLIDTAPAYGASEERLGRLLPGPREDWVIAAANAGQDKFPSELHITVKVGNTTVQTLRFHTSCSQPLGVGDQFGSLRITGWTPRPARVLDLPSHTW